MAKKTSKFYSKLKEGTIKKGSVFDLGRYSRLGSNSIFELKVTKIMEGFVYDEKPPLIDIDPKINYLLAVK